MISTSSMHFISILLYVGIYIYIYRIDLYLHVYPYAQPHNRDEHVKFDILFFGKQTKNKTQIGKVPIFVCA